MARQFRRVVEGRAVAYHRTDDGYEQDMPFEDVIGHGGLLTTVGDLSIWNEALAHQRLGPAITAQLEQETTLLSGQPSQYGRGLSVRRYRGALEFAHDGATAGYRAWLGRYPEQALSIAILCNADDARPHRIGRALALQILGLPVDGAAPSTRPTASRAHAGAFYSEFLGQRLLLGYRDGSLTLPDGPPCARSAPTLTGTRRECSPSPAPTKWWCVTRAWTRCAIAALPDRAPIPPHAAS